ncbi:HlyD family secretion protein [Nisaea sp.]|uniref:HlyD family secretion protein n=1 Tax=Nisaea sp. TaxID=2024842 RepID=UPI002B2747BB|nr:efflux RND transporter periplasmic adaptor subunit [Nisaea sp.]
MPIRPNRIFLSVAIIGAAAFGMSPSVFVIPSIDAVVNAEITVVSSMSEGTVKGGPPAVGTRVRKGSQLAETYNNRQDQSFMGELRTEKVALTERIDALDRQENALRDTADELAARVSAYGDFTLKHLSRRLAEAEADREAIAAERQHAGRELDRQKTLLSKDATSKAKFENAEFKVKQLDARLSQKNAIIERLNVRRQSVQQTTFLSEGQNDVPYSQQRLDEIRLRLFDLEARRSEYTIRVREIERQFETETKRLAATRLTRLYSPVDGIVWKRFVKPGNEVVTGIELLEIVDCANAFLDVSLEEESFSRIRIGDEAEVRLVGANAPFSARVLALRGAGAITEDRLLAARPQMRGPREFQAILSFDPQQHGAGPQNFCLIGRSAEVAFTRFADTGRFATVADAFGAIRNFIVKTAAAAIPENLK